MESVTHMMKSKPGRESKNMFASLKLLRHPWIRIVLISNLLTQTGIWVRNFAVLFYVVNKTGGDAFAVSMISVAEYAPMLVFALIGGVFADRWPPRRTLIWCDALAAVSIWIVLAAMKSGAWEAVFFPTLISAVLSQLSQPSGMRLFQERAAADLIQPAMSVLQTMFAVFMVLGPVLGTWVYQTFGIGVSMGLTGTVFLLSAAVLGWIPADSKAEGGGRRKGTSVFREMRDGIRYVTSNRVLGRLSLCFAAVGLGIGLISPLSVFIVTDKLGLPADHLKWLSIPYGAGEIAGGIAALALAGRMAPQTLLMLGLIVNAAGIAVTGWSGMLWLTMLAQFVIALLQPAIFIGNQTLVMQHTEPEYIGRVSGIRTPLMTGAMLLMMSLSGVLAGRLPLGIIYSLAGLCLLIGLLTVLPLYRQRESAPASRPE